MPIPPFAVPPITSDEAETLSKIFKPIKIEDNKAELIQQEGIDLFRHSFLWSPKLNPYKGDLFTLDSFWSVHDYGYQGIFKPSLAEVYAQIPACYHKLELCYFETIGPEDCHDLNLWIDHVNAGVHVAKTILYLPEPTGRVMAKYWYENKDMLNLTCGGTKSELSATRFLDSMHPDARLEVMANYCPMCGNRKKEGCCQLPKKLRF